MTDDVVAFLDGFDRAFAAGDADALTAFFSDDAQLLLLFREPIVGRAAIRDRWLETFAQDDTSAWRTSRLLVEVHGTRGFALSTYTETLVPRRPGPSRLVRGRLVHVLRRDPDGAWRAEIVMNSHSHRMEELPGT